MEEKGKPTATGTNETPRYTDAQRLGARVALLVLAVLLAVLVILAVAGYDFGQMILPLLALMILGPVFAWLMLWSYSRMRMRSCDAGDAALRKQFVLPDTVVFDIGDVLTDFSWESWLAASGLPKDMLRRIAKASVLSPAWKELDRGVLSYEDCVDLFVKNDPEAETEIRTVFSRAFSGIVTARARAIPWIRELKAAGCRVLYLSNFSVKSHTECADALGFLAECDGGLMSYTDHLLKPAEDFFRLLIERYDVKPEHTVFIDDMPDNVETARKLGFSGIVYTSQAQAEHDLRALGINY